MKKLIVILISILIVSCSVNTGLYSNKSHKYLPKHISTQSHTTNGLINKK